MTNRPPLRIKRRNFLVLGFIAVFDGVLMARLVNIQTVDSANLKRIADDIHFRGVPLAPFRGNIVDRQGRLLAGSHHSYSVYAIPIQTRKHREEEALLLSTLLSVPQDRVMRRLKRRQGFVWLKRRISATELASMHSQMKALPGVYLVTETSRYYPEGKLAGPVLGYTGIDNQGLSGVELVYNRYLEGKPGRIMEEYDASGNEVRFSKQKIAQPQQGDTVELTLDEKIQWMAERAVAQAMLSTGGRSVSITVMHPKTGGILALAQRPSIDPNHFRDYKPQNSRVLAVSDAIPPGSIFKPVTVAASLQEGTSHPSTGFYCPGFKKVLGRRVNCWRPEGHGAETMVDVVKNSCNVGFMDLGLRLGVEKFYTYLDKFGLTQRTHVDLPGEARGIFPRQARVTALDLAVMAFGQTLTVTPIALLNAVSALANGGNLLVPHVVKQISTPQGRLVKNFDGQVVRRVVSDGVAEQVQNMMVNVVHKGTGRLAQVPGYRVAGKTGTAQKVMEGRVVRGVYIASFIGFAPVPNPEVAILVSVDEPQGAYYGGQVAAPIFARLMHDILRYLDIKPTEPIKAPKPGEPAMVPNLVNLDPNTARQDAEAFGFSVRFHGTGKTVVQQSVEYGGWRQAGTRLTLTLGHDSRIYLDWVAIPDFRGLPVQKAQAIAYDLGLDLHIYGNVRSGTIRTQSMLAGHQVRAGTSVMVSVL